MSGRLLLVGLDGVVVSFTTTTELGGTWTLLVNNGVLIMSDLLKVVERFVLVVMALVFVVASEPCLRLKELLAATMAAAASLKLSVRGTHPWPWKRSYSL